MLSARHLRRLVAELDSMVDLKIHQDRMVVSVLGDPSSALRIVDDARQIIVDQSPMGFPLYPQGAAPAVQRIVATMLRTWHDDHGLPIRGMAVVFQLRDGTHVTIVVARSLADREAILRR